MIQRRTCTCLDPQYKNHRWGQLRIHDDIQDTECDAWRRLLDLIEQAAADRREEFSLWKDFDPELVADLVTLPASIAKLKAVKRLILYGSSLVQLPPEIGQMAALEDFDPYTSYRLHWFPYEITRCARLVRSRVSTRALYGNYKFRPPFPRLPQRFEEITPATCSVCNGPFSPSGPQQFWISLKIATDVLPLLVHACSEACVGQLPRPAADYVDHPHQGGFALKQPQASDR